jgi:hypothetical protein
VHIHIIVFARGKKVCVGVDKEQHTDHYISVGRCLTKMNVYVGAMDSAREQDRGEWNAL